jgi:hypothetical protein
MRRTIACLMVSLAAVAVSASQPPPARAAESTCPATFHVLHDDHVGKLSLPAGHYEITLLNAARLSCADASDLFRQFLERFTGKLPKPWRVIPAASEFRRGDSDVGFRVRRVGSPSGGGGGGRHPQSGRACPASFSVLHNDRIGRLRLPKGEYRITPLSAGRPGCSRASRLFARFLQDWDGRLPGRWRVHPATATFSKNPHFGFRVKRIRGGSGGGGGGGTHPAGGAQRCPGTFRVLHNDRIGRLRLPQGRYRITVLAPNRLSCARASRLFTRFLENSSGDLPRPWRVRARTATFLRGGSGVGFRVKLVR